MLVPDILIANKVVVVMYTNDGKENIDEMYFILTAVLQEFPFTVVERAHITVAQPTRYAVVMKSVIAYAPCNRAP